MEINEVRTKTDRETNRIEPVKIKYEYGKFQLDNCQPRPNVIPGETAESDKPKSKIRGNK